MADGTRLRLLDEAVKQLTDSPAAHSAQLDSLHTTLTAQQSAFSDLVLRFTDLDGRLEQVLLNSTPSPPPNPPLSPGPIHTRTMKLDFPCFDGTNPVGWLFKAKRFFDYHSTVDDQRLLISSFHMDGPALQWFQWMFRTSQFTSWPVFTRALEVRFGPSDFDDPQASLSKLIQTSSVTDYQSQFETLANRITNLSPSFLVSCFVSGLRQDICHEVMAFRPSTMAVAMGLARLQEAKLHESRTPPSRSPPFKPPLLPSPPSPEHPVLPKIPIKHLTPMEMQLRRDKGLCYNCDDKFSPGHHCKTRRGASLALVALTRPEPALSPNRAWAKDFGPKGGLGPKYSGPELGLRGGLGLLFGPPGPSRPVPNFWP